ncbi:Shedu immune nuclease family protein [Amycolatopsis sp. NPDC059027]|uniref:Shedu immune nuclease family protein n=1 Tax=Amycolatopsis sp. NPDC059027 TaxID=3346709 RepID=UPI00366A58E4
MAPNFQRGWLNFPTPDFVVEGGDFSTLEVRAGSDGTFHFFYDTKYGRVIKSFVLDDRPRVATLCDVTLIKKEGGYSPRLKFWKKDKTKANAPTLELELPDNDAARVVKASVDTSDAHKNFWTLIDFLQSFKGMELPPNQFRVVSADSAQLVEQLQDADRATALEAVRTVLGSSLTQADIHLITNRKAQLDYFARLLADEDFFESERAKLDLKGKEAPWQHFFEQNPWIFGYGLNLISCQAFDDGKLERYTTGGGLFIGGAKRSDAVLRSRSFVSSLLFCEIKTHATPLLEARAYREPDVYQVSRELTGAVSQVQKTTDKAVRDLSDYIRKHTEKDGTPTDIEFSTVRPKQVVVIGNMSQFEHKMGVNAERFSSFEFYRRGITDVEIITFDELYERARFIVAD